MKGNQRGNFFIMQVRNEDITKNLKYLTLLSDRYPTIQSASTQIINLQALLNLPKGTEHFMSDLHGEYEAFVHILNNASGVIREKIDLIFEKSVSSNERADLATLIYYPEQKLEQIKTRNYEMDEWYEITLYRLVEVLRVVSSKYTRPYVAKALPSDFGDIIDELLNTNIDLVNKEQYYGEIISTIIEIDRADAFIIEMSALIKRLAVDHLHIVGDIFDRGPRADIIMESLINHHSVDIQWGNHDILWMGAAAGSKACIANILNFSAKYNNLDSIEDGYGINLRTLAAFAMDAYKDDPCTLFAPVSMGENANYSQRDVNLCAKMHKAIVVMQFKLEGQIIKKHPEYNMEKRLLLDKMDLEKGIVTIEGKEFALKDTYFPTIDKKDPYKLTEDEQFVIDGLQVSFMQSEKLQRHVRFLFANGGVYKCYNSNLLYHGCVPMEKDGSFMEFCIDGKKYKGKALLDYCDFVTRQAYFAKRHTKERSRGLTFIWYLWCGEKSPLFGKEKMTTFERYLIDDEDSKKEPKNAYYTYENDRDVCVRILEEFGLNPG